MRGRGRVCETIAVHSSFMLIKNDVDSLRTTLQMIVDRDPDMQSIGLRHSESGNLLIEIGDHSQQWTVPTDGTSTETNMLVPLRQKGQLWGNIEVAYCSVATADGAPLFAWPTLALIGYVACCGLVVYYVYLRMVLQQLNPSNVVPGRVREALDTLAEGLLIIDDQERIVLANDAFTKTSGRSRNELMGKRADDIPWIEQHDADLDEADHPTTRPWTRALHSGAPTSGDILQLSSIDDEATEADARTFLVNSTPIFDSKGKSRGALASFEDVTRLEKKKTELSDLVAQLQISGEEVRQKNEELTRLATRDPLTDCLNRRSFFELFEQQFTGAERYEFALSAIMVDIDHFKSINDTHGHGVGDAVLQKVAAALNNTARESDIVCRYGGEEFSIVLPHSDIASAEAAAEKFRIAIETLKFPQLSITASLGVSCTGLGATDPQTLLDQADKCLYFAKRNGRNQVARFDQIPTDVEVDESKISRTKAVIDPNTNAIPFHAVTALISALGYRDHATAEHSRRVADLCVSVAEGLMTRRDCYILEIAGLLHDIGKVGVPDSILLKQNSLSPQDWDVMRRHDLIGSEIIRSSFQSAQLSAIIDNYRVYFDGSQTAGSPCGNDLPIGARILSIADSYDAMVSEKVYRKPMTREEAFAELRRCKGSQFDPNLVDHFIANVTLTVPVEECVSSMSKQTALNIGLQLERLATALDDHDLNSLKTMANRIHETASREGVPEIAETASQLEAQVESDGDLIEILHLANELMRQCRAARGSILLDQTPISR